MHLREGVDHSIAPIGLMVKNVFKDWSFVELDFKEDNLVLPLEFSNEFLAHVSSVKQQRRNR